METKQTQEGNAYKYLLLYGFISLTILFPSISLFSFLIYILDLAVPFPSLGSSVTIFLNVAIVWEGLSFWLLLVLYIIML